MNVIITYITYASVLRKKRIGSGLFINKKMIYGLNQSLHQSSPAYLAFQSIYRALMKKWLCLMIDWKNNSTFSSHGRRTVRRDFNPCVDMLILFQCLIYYLSFLCFKARTSDQRSERHQDDAQELYYHRIIWFLHNNSCAGNLI